jgi:hypothetical protein
MNVVNETIEHVAAPDTRVRALTNDALIIELIQTLNHLSRWLTPIHDRTRLEVSAYRSVPSIKEIVISLRDNEARVYALMNAIATATNPDLDRVPRLLPSADRHESDRTSNALVVMSEFRRVRESTTALLRALPDNAWERSGYSRTARNWTIRELAESLAMSDLTQLEAIDNLLAASGARQGIAAASRVTLDQLDKPFAFQIGRG